MTSQSTAPRISNDWLCWLREFRVTAGEVIQNATAMLSEKGTLRELLSVKFALYARFVTKFGTACLLAENDKLFDLRCCSRELIECAIHMGAADASYPKALKDDDLKSRRARAEAFKKRQKPVDAASMKLLDNFLGQDFGKLERLEPSKLAAASQFPRLYHAYREMSADAAHVTFTSLARHCVLGADGDTTCIIDPSITVEELEETLTMAALSALVCTFLLTKSLTEGDAVVERFADLQVRYTALVRS